MQSALARLPPQVPVHVPEVLNTETADWIPFRGSLSFFFSLSFSFSKLSADETCDFAKCLCLCLCLCPREKLREDVFLAMSLPSYLQIKVGFVSQKYVSERERSLRE